MLLNNTWLKEVSREIQKFIESNENASTKICHALKVVLWGKFIALSTYTTKKKKDVKSKLPL